MAYWFKWKIWLLQPLQTERTRQQGDLPPIENLDGEEEDFPFFDKEQQREEHPN